MGQAFHVHNTGLEQHHVGGIVGVLECYDF